MDPKMRLRMCLLADKIHNDPGFAEKIQVKDTSHFKLKADKNKNK